MDLETAAMELAHTSFDRIELLPACAEVEALRWC